MSSILTIYQHLKMSAQNQFIQAVTLLTNLNSISQSTHPSDANLEYMQRELFNTISNIVSLNRQNAFAERVQQAINAGNVTVRRPRRRRTREVSHGPYTAPLHNHSRSNPLEKSIVIAKKKLEEACPSECAICQETPKYKDAVCTDCNHYYCKTCWNLWMNTDGSNKNCPTCRKDLPRTTSYKARASPKPNGPLTQAARIPVMYDSLLEDDIDDDF